MADGFEIEFGIGWSHYAQALSRVIWRTNLPNNIGAFFGIVLNKHQLCGKIMNSSMEWPRTLAQAVDSIIASLDEENRRVLLDSSRADLIRYHHGWGMGIRNALGLWGDNRELLADCGSPDMHADNASMVIMCAVWNRLHDLPIEEARDAPNRTREDHLREFGPDTVYRMGRNSGAKEQSIYRRLKQLFGFNYRQFKEFIARVDAEDAKWKAENSGSE